MNNKGFTLLEILATLVVLSIVIVIVSTNGFGAFNNAKNKLGEIDEKTIVEAAKLLMVEIEHCDEEINVDLLKNENNTDFSFINGLTATDPTSNEYPSCKNLINLAKGEQGIKIPLNYLIDNNLVSGNEIIKLKGTDILYKGNFILKDGEIVGIEVNKSGS